jgi:hypothetical protein
VVRELQAEHPVVDLRVFKVRTYATGVFLMTVMGFALLQGLRGAFAAAGADPYTAARQAEAAAAGLVSRQASMLAFVSVFRLLASFFVLLLPLVLLMRSPKGQGSEKVSIH